MVLFVALAHVLGAMTSGAGFLSAGGGGSPTPPEVLVALTKALGSDLVGEVGYEVAAAKCTSAEEKADALQRGSSLLYGELLPDGVSKALLPDYLGGSLWQKDGSYVLELGMGSGKVALQIFLQCPCVRKVLGIELVPSRYGIAETALSQLVSAYPVRDMQSVCAGQLRVTSHNQGDFLQVEESATGREIEFRCADFFDLGLDLVEKSDAIVFAVNIPSKLFPKLCQRLAQAKDGCRLFTYHALSNIWWTAEQCPFQQVQVNRPEADTFSTSWSPNGFKFYVYVCDRSVPADIHSTPRNETFSQWQAIFDEASQAYYYHNTETEISQWEVPAEIGCWQAVWTEEHKAYFYWHEATQHSQWEVPQCFADLGWGQVS